MEPGRRAGAKGWAAQQPAVGGPAAPRSPPQLPLALTGQCGKHCHAEVQNFTLKIQKRFSEKRCISSFTLRFHFIPNGYDLIMSPLNRAAMLL